jgi:DNA-binding NarL/FixJ family response regulator
MDSAVKSVLIVDDHILFREGLMSLFRFSPEFKVLDGAGSVKEAYEKASVYHPDIILMDFSLPDGTGLDAARAILNEQPDCKIVFLTVYDTDDKLFAALRVGAKGFILKSVASSDLISSLHGLERGEMAVSRLMMSHVLQEFSHASVSPESAAQAAGQLAKLSPREMDVLRELESGATNADIAMRLFLSENTVKHHIRNIFDKLAINNRGQAAHLARQQGLKSKHPSSHLN